MILSAAVGFASVVWLGIYIVLLFSKNLKAETFYQRHAVLLSIITLVASALPLALLCVLRVMGISSNGQTVLQYISLFVIPISVVFCLAGERLKHAFTNRGGYRFFRTAVIGLLAVVCCELFVFNFASYALDEKSAAYPYQELSLADAQITNLERTQQGVRSKGVGKASLRFSDLQIPVKTIYVELETDKSAKTVNAYYTELTDTDQRSRPADINIIRDDPHSGYILCSFSGPIKQLNFQFQVDSNETVVISNIVLNKPISVMWSWTRLGLLYLLFCGAAALLLLPSLRQPVGEGGIFKAVTACVLTVCVCAAFCCSFLGSEGIAQDFKNPDKNQINAELVDAFAAGQVSLLREVEPELLQMENPYDRSARDNAGVSYAWDHVLYDGQYYSYYGIAPVFILFLPYHLITGSYFPTVWAVWLFGAVGLVFLGLTYYQFVKKFFGGVANGIAICGLLIALMISGVWFCFCEPNFYEIAQNAGFAFVTAGAYFLLSSNVVGTSQISKWRLALSSVCLSFGVLSRPTLAVYCIAALLFIVCGARKLVKTAEKPGYKHNKAVLCRYLCAGLIPYILIGGVQMLYNWLRFDSFFDFGIQYSLTVNDFTNTQFAVPLALVGLYDFIFTVPNFSTSFPFVHSNYSVLSVNGYYFTANSNAVGILFRALPTFCYGLAYKGYKASGKNKTAALLILVSCVLMPLVIILSIWESGYGVRYCVDFSWEILFGALAIAFALYIYSAGPQMKRAVYAFFVVSVLFALLVNGAQIWAYACYYSGEDAKAGLYWFGRLFEFWNLM